MWGEPQLDAHQFAGKRSKAVSAKTGIAWSDFGKMHTYGVKPVARRKPIPEWANNDTALCEIVLKFCEEYLYVRDHSGTGAERLQRIADASEQRLPELGKELRTRLEEFHQLTKEGTATEEQLRRFAIVIANRDSQIVMLRRGLPALVTAVITYSYRLGHDSVNVAEQLGIKPPMVRIWLWRCNRLAEGKTKGVVHRVSKTLPLPKEKLRQFFAMRAQGYSFSECSKALGTSATRLYKIWNQRFSEKWDAVRLQRLSDLRASGLSFNQCAKRLGTATYNAIKVWRKNFGGAA